MNPEGSVWRKWDFHVHTPASYEWQGRRFAECQAEEADQICEQLIERMNLADADAFVVMDYWTFDGYLRLRAFLSRRGDLRLTKALFPGIELRVEAPTHVRLNIHVVLSDTLSEQHFRDFKAALQIPLVERSLSEDSLAEVATRMPPDIVRRLGCKATDLDTAIGRLKIGQRTAVVSRKSLFRAIDAVPDGQALLFLPFDTYHGVRDIAWVEHPLLTTDFMTHAHILEVRQREAIDACQGNLTPENRAFFANFIQTLGGRPKPAVSGSDAHHPDKYAVFPVDKDGAERCTWVKAEPTFRGIRQLLTEPRSRVFIGPLPPKVALVRDHPTKFIRSLAIRKVADSDLAEAWFDVVLRFNHDLVAIIGNRGNGKSALADILGLLGRSRNHPHFSFLHKDKFRRPKLNKAKHFEAVLTWESGETVSCSLDDSPSAAEVERVRYLPQNYLETVCNEIKLKQGEGFDSELKAVIFSHVPLPERLGKASLDELLEFNERQTNQTIEILKGQLHDLNAEIVQVEQRLTPEHREGLEGQLSLKEQELAAHLAAKPAEVLPPSSDPEARTVVAETTDQIEELRAELSEVESAIGGAEAEVRTRTLDLAGLAAAEGQLDNFERVYEELLGELAESLRGSGIEPADVVKITIDRTPMAAKRAALDGQVAAAKGRLEMTQPESLVCRKAALARRVASLQASLEGPAKLFQEYVTALGAWQSDHDAITGSDEVPGTLANLRKQIAALDDLPGRREALLHQRREKAREIYAEIDHLAETYRAVYRPVQDFSSQHSLIHERFGLNFSVSIQPSGALAERFFALVNRHSSGSFCGAQEGEEALKGIVDRQDFSSAVGALAFAGELLDHLTHDRREGKEAPAVVTKQLRKQQTVEALYDFVFSFGYLTPEYNLNLGQKALSQLSAGERGMLLLMFYLNVRRFL